MNISISKDNRCIFIKSDGARCSAYSTKDSNYCFFHSPQLVMARSIANRKGGLSRRKQEIHSINRVNFLICSKCQEEKQLTQFYLRKDSNKYEGICRNCKNERVREWAKRTNYNKQFYQRNRNRRLPQSKKYYWDNRDVELAKAKDRGKLRKTELPDYYIVDMLTKGTGLKSQDIPQEIIETKRQHLKLIKLKKEIF